MLRKLSQVDIDRYYSYEYTFRENVMFYCNIYATHQISQRIMFRVLTALLCYEKCVTVEIQLPCGTSSQLEGTRFADTTSSQGSHYPLRGQPVSSYKIAFP